MPYKLRKAPKKELYWVSEIETNKKFSKLPIPLDKAKAQMRVLESALKGGIRIPRGMHNPSDEGDYDLEDEIERSINPRARELQPKAVRHPRPDDEPEGPEGPPPAKMSRTSGRSGRGKRGGFSPQDFIAYDKRHPTIPQSLNDTIPYGIARWYDLLTILSPTDKARISEKYGDRDILTEMNTRAKELLREHENRNRNRPQMSDLEYATKSQEFRIPLFEIIEEGKKEFPSYEEPVNYPGGSGKRKSKRKGGMMPGSISGNPKEGPIREVLNPIPRRVLDPSAPRRLLDPSAPRRIFVSKSEPVPTVLETVKDCLKCKKSNSGKGKDDDDKYALFQKIEKQLADLINKQQNEKDYDQIDALITNLKSEAESFLARPGAKEEHKMYIRFVLHTAIPGLLTRLAKIPKQASGKYKKCRKCGKFKV